jgi:hypothetical protein
MAQEKETQHMTDSEKLEFLAGRVHGLIGFATAIITSHPNLGVLAHHLKTVGEINLARAETELVSDEYVRGVEDVKGRVERAVEIALAQMTNPK